MTSSLVVLTDFFAVSNRALSYAAELAVPLHAHLVLLHVRYDGLLSPANYRRLHTPAGEQRTDQALLRLAAAQPVPTAVDVSEQFLSDAVKEAVVRHHPLLLVLGRPGSATTPEEMVVGTALDLLRHAPYPLLVVPTVGWDSFPPRRLLLAVDGESFQLYEGSPDALGQLLTATNGTLQVVHVTDDEHARPVAVDVLATLQANHLAGSLAAEQVSEVYQPTVVGGVLQEAARLEADLLVLVARRHSLLGSLFHRSVTAQLLQESPIPILLLPAED